MTILAFIFWVVIALFASGIVTHRKDTQPKNKVHFYVTCDNVLYKKNPVHILWIGKPIKKSSNLYTRTSKSLGIASDDTFYNYGLNIDDFADMGVGEIREVFINMED